MSDRVVVFIDYQNVHGWARRQFLDWHVPQSAGHVQPDKLAELLVSRRQRPSELHQVRVYRGRPNPARQQGAARANDRQAADWERKERVTVIRRNLQYPPDWPVAPAVEKGIDVALAVDVVRMSIRGELDVAIVNSSDKDLLPAIETVVDLKAAHVEVAAWAASPRLRFEGEQRPWCHYLGAEDFARVRDFVDYSAADS